MYGRTANSDIISIQVSIKPCHFMSLLCFFQVLVPKIFHQLNKSTGNVKSATGQTNQEPSFTINCLQNSNSKCDSQRCAIPSPTFHPSPPKKNIKQINRYHPWNQHSTWKLTPGKGDPYWKPSFLGAILVLGRVTICIQQLPLAASKGLRDSECSNRCCKLWKFTSNPCLSKEGELVGGLNQAIWKKHMSENWIMKPEGR